MDLDSASLAPGFRFHPTDEELVRYYLRRKICNKPFRFDAISDVEIYKVEPWDLPGRSRLKTRDLEWYFFSVLDKKYGNGSRTNRATNQGYWKTTGKDRAVYHRTQIVGMKKTLVYHNGRAPQGKRTNWVMHEYRLVDDEMEKAGISQDAFVLCRIFQKSGSGPKNGEQYGAPYLDEEWENDELAIVAKDNDAMELPLCDDAYLDSNDLEQILNAVDPLHNDPIIVNSSIGNGSDYVHEPINFSGNAQQACVVDGNNYVQEQPDDRATYNLPVQIGMEEKSFNNGYIADASYGGVINNNVNALDVNHMSDLAFLDATDNFPSGNGEFIETNDLNQPFDMDPSSFEMLSEYLQFFDADDNLQNMGFDNLQNMGLEYTNMFESEELPSNSASLFPCKDSSEGTKQETGDGMSKNFVSSSEEAKTKYQPDCQYQFLKQASHLLGDVSAPPALASEFPTKDVTLRLNSTSASSIRVSADILQTRDVTLGRAGLKWSCGKHGLANVVLCFGLSRGDGYSATPQPSSDTLSKKSNSAISWGWFYFMFMWVLLLSTSIKIGTYIYAK